MGVTIVYNVYKMAADTGIWCGLVSSVERWSVSTGVVIFFTTLVYLQAGVVLTQYTVFTQTQYMEMKITTGDTLIVLNNVSPF